MTVRGAQVLSELQRRLAHACRSGDLAQVPEIEARRVEIYRRSVFRGIVRGLEKAYPLTKAALREYWEPLCVEFFSQHPCSSPHLWQMPRGLYEFVRERGADQPWLIELLHFEWSEIEVHMGPDMPVNFRAAGDLAVDPVVINPSHQLTRYTYPVFRDLPDQLVAGNHYLLAYRHPVALNVRYLELPPLLAVAVAALGAQPMPVPEVLELCCQQLDVEFDQKTRQEVFSIFECMLHQGAALGFAH